MPFAGPRSETGCRSIASPKSECSTRTFTTEHGDDGRLQWQARLAGSWAWIERVSGMALTATIYNFDVELADADRGVYESLALRVARHPSESEEYLVARVLAYLLEYTEGIEFSRGVSDPQDPTIAVRDLSGAIRAWIDIGTPAAARLHKASKAVGRVAVYTHKDPALLLKQLAGETIHRAEALELYAIDRALLG